MSPRQVAWQSGPVPGPSRGPSGVRGQRNPRGRMNGGFWGLPVSNPVLGDRGGSPLGGAISGAIYWASTKDRSSITCGAGATAGQFVTRKADRPVRRFLSANPLHLSRWCRGGRDANGHCPPQDAPGTLLTERSPRKATPPPPPLIEL